VLRAEWEPRERLHHGISLALLIKPRPTFCGVRPGAFLAIASKYVLTYRGRHLWNPSNFAIALLSWSRQTASRFSSSVGQRHPHQPGVWVRLAVASGLGCCT